VVENGEQGTDTTATLIVMYGARSWPLGAGKIFTFGRSKACSVVLHAADRGVSRRAGSLRHHDGAWWIHNDSQACLLYVSGDRGFRADIPPGMRQPLQQWHAKVRLTGALGSYTLLLRLPDLDDQPGPGDGPGPGEAGAAHTDPGSPVPMVRPDQHAITTIRFRPRLTDSDRLVLTARFEKYLTWRYPGAAAPCTARDAAERIGWKPHAVVKRCENIRERYARHGAPGLRGPRALEELAALLTSTGELTAADLRRLPA
jgi:hypothetical protein